MLPARARILSVYVSDVILVALLNEPEIEFIRQFAHMSYASIEAFIYQGDCLALLLLKNMNGMD